MKPNVEHIFLGIAISDAYGAGLEFQAGKKPSGNEN